MCNRTKDELIWLESIIQASPYTESVILCLDVVIALKYYKWTRRSHLTVK